MKKILITLAIGIFLLTGSPSHSATIDAAVNLYGSDFLQSFQLKNNSTGGLSITKIVYSLGTAADGIATWDTSTGGGVASDYLSNPEWFQTVTWTGLSIAPGASYSIGGFSLDIDLIQTLSPLSVTGGIIDYVGSSLANAYFGVEYNDGYGLRTVELNETGWTTDQNLQITAPVPLPSAFLLLGPGLLGLAALKKKFVS
jgi:hypothetical protein